MQESIGAIMKFLGNGGFSKFTGTLLIFIFTIGAGYIAMQEALAGQPINGVVYGFLGVVLGQAIASFSSQLGADKVVSGAALSVATSTTAATNTQATQANTQATQANTQAIQGGH